MARRTPNRFAWNPGYARFQFTKLITLLIITYPIERALSLVDMLDHGPLGGIDAWILSALFLTIAIIFFNRWANQLHNAESCLDTRELPCTRCGYPLPRQRHPTCPGCGTPHTWADTARYWKNENLVDPLKIRSAPPQDH